MDTEQLKLGITPSVAVTVLEAARALDVSPDTIRRWEKKGLIKASRSEHNYRLFNLDEITRINNKTCGKTAENKYKVLKSENATSHSCIELFAGCGGMALGFGNAGIQHVLLNELNGDAVHTLRTNAPGWNVIKADASSLNFRKYRADIVEAGFPCQAFSYAGKKMGFEDTRGTLFFEFARCIKETRPKIAIGENVRGLLRHNGGKTLNTMISVLDQLGYRVAYKVLRSQYLDVPQKRERLIIVAVRKDIDIPILFPKEQDYTISVREALVNCPDSEGQEYSEKKKRAFLHVPPGGYWRDLPTKLQEEYMGASLHLSGGKTGMARRLSWDEPCLTLTCSPAQKQTERCHPEKTRPLTIREYARIQTFPDEWGFHGSIASRYKQIGNAVPVNLAFHIGMCLIAMLENKEIPHGMEMKDPLKQHGQGHFF